MPQTNTIARTLHDVGLAAWFGGSLMGAVGLNGAAAAVDDPRERTRVSSVGWSRWSPVEIVAVGTHVVGSTQLLFGNKGRTFGQAGVGSTSAVKTGLLAAALVATAAAELEGRKVGTAQPPSRGATEPSAATPDDVAAAQRRLKVLQWVVPALTGALLVINARMGEQQRPLQVAGGVLRRVLPGG
jgi:hypothetical protein